MKMFTEHLALAVANLNLRESLRTQAIRDPLTVLFNRPYMEESLDREFRRSLRRESPLTILIIDIDHFRQLSDSHGYEAGDAVLRELAKLFQAQLRVEDIASRYGGEEFLLISPETDIAAARECGERLRQATHAMRYSIMAKLLKESAYRSVWLAFRNKAVRSMLSCALPMQRCIVPRLMVAIAWNWSNIEQDTAAKLASAGSATG